MLGRRVYAGPANPVRSFNFEEDFGGDKTNLVWSNAAYALGTRLTGSFADYGWCVAISGVETGGLVEGLPTYQAGEDSGHEETAEVSFNDRMEWELSEEGFIPLCHCKHTDYAVFFTAQSCNKPRRYDNGDADAGAYLFAQLSYVFAFSRFVHYLKMVSRDRTGAHLSGKETESFLSRWLNRYVLAENIAPGSQGWEYPLRDGRIELVEIPGKPGMYRAVLTLKFRFDQLSVPLRQVIDLPNTG